MDWFSEHEAWMDQLRGFMGEHGEDLDALSNDDLMFVSNLAAATMRGDISLPGAIEEIVKWTLAKQGIMAMEDEESFELELRVNHPDLIEITERVKANLIYADEPGIADGIRRIWAHPAFMEFVPESSTVAMTGKAWFNIGGMNQHEHATMGWAIARAVQDANEG